MFTLRATLGAFGDADRPIEIIDSSQLSPTLDPDGFGEDARRRHGEHRDDGRAGKGRVFYVTAARKPIAFLAFHVPPEGPLVIETLAVDERVSADVRSALRVELLMAITEASEAAGRPKRRIAWATGKKTIRDAVVEQLGFTPAPKPDTSQRPRYYLERSIP